MLAALATACGGSASPTAPDTTMPGAAPSATGATIAGTVQSSGVGSSSTGSIRALAGAAGIRVSVSGTALSTVTDDSGRFTLAGVPGSRAELHFEGSGVDARLEIEGLVSGQTLTITVRVDGSRATIASPEDGSEVEFRGRVDSVGADRLVVSGRTVLVSSATRLLSRDNQPVPLSSFRENDFVEVEGRGLADGGVAAEKVKLEDEDEVEDQNDVEFTGRIERLSPLTVAGQTVRTDGNTRILDDRNQPVPFSSLKVNDNVEVEGHRQADGSVLAKKIKIED
jgi:hypothetical protein